MAPPILPPAGQDWTSAMTGDLTPPRAGTILPQPRPREKGYWDWSPEAKIPLFDFSSWLERWFFPRPGPIIVPKRGSPVPPPGQPAEKGGSQKPAAVSPPRDTAELISRLIPTVSQRRDIAVYGLAVIVFLIAIVGILLGGGRAIYSGTRKRVGGTIRRGIGGKGAQ